jgi:hypothetical protein
MPLGTLPVIAAMVLILPIYGQKTASEEQHDQKATQKETTPPASAAGVDKPAAKTQEQRHANQPDDYFDALFSPNNIPNVTLTLVGIVGIVITLRTLNWLKTQTRAIERQASLMEQQATDARAAAIETATVANSTLRAIERQADLMERQILVAERPWISPTVTITTGLTFHPHGVLTMGVSIKLSNLGKSPAVRIAILTKFYFPSHVVPGLAEVRSNLCREATETEFPWGQIVFGSGEQSYVENWGVAAKTEEVDRASIGNGLYPLMLLVCIGYRSTINPEARYYTAISYNLHRVDPNYPGQDFVFKRGEDVPLDLLRITLSPVSGPVAT